MSELEPFLHDAHSSRSFVTIEGINPDVPMTCGDTTSAPLSLAKALQTLHASDPSPRLVSLTFDHTRDLIDMSPARQSNE